MTRYDLNYTFQEIKSALYYFFCVCLRRNSDDGLTTQFDGRIEAFKPYRTQVHKIIWINVTLLLTQWVINVALEPHFKTKLCRPQWKSRQASRINRTSLSFSIENTGTTFFIGLHQKFALMLNYVVCTQMVVGFMMPMMTLMVMTWHFVNVCQTTIDICAWRRLDHWLFPALFRLFKNSSVRKYLFLHRKSFLNNHLYLQNTVIYCVYCKY